MRPKTLNRATAAALIAVGSGLLVHGYGESRTLGNRVASAVTGDPTNDVILLLVAGAVLLVAGLILQFRA